MMAEVLQEGIFLIYDPQDIAERADINDVEQILWIFFFIGLPIKSLFISVRPYMPDQQRSFN